MRSRSRRRASPNHLSRVRVTPDCRREAIAVDALVEQLDSRLREWKPETATEVRARVTEIMELADRDVLDVMRSRGIEQEVLDLLDELTTR